MLLENTYFTILFLCMLNKISCENSFLVRITASYSSNMKCNTFISFKFICGIKLMELPVHQAKMKTAFLSYTSKTNYFIYKFNSC